MRVKHRPLEQSFMLGLTAPYAISCSIENVWLTAVFLKWFSRFRNVPASKILKNNILTNNFRLSRFRKCRSRVSTSLELVGGRRRSRIQVVYIYIYIDVCIYIYICNYNYSYIIYKCYIFPTKPRLWNLMSKAGFQRRGGAFLRQAILGWGPESLKSLRV